MELVLNLVWLLLAVPAYWVWRRQSRKFGSLRCLVTLGCVLFLLFPVISATDDLHAMRPEMEESSPTKRTVKQTGGAKSYTQSHFGIPPANVPNIVGVNRCNDVCERVPAWLASRSLAPAIVVRSGRAPPTSPLV
jgi:hypothetical protein